MDRTFTSYDWMNGPVSMGTTIIGAEYNGGVVLAADTRTTTGAYIANRITNKISKISDNIYVCRSGSAADTQAISEIAAYQLNFHSIEMAKQPLVKCGANVLKELCYNHRDQLTAGVIVGGWDHLNRGQVYAIPLGAMCLRQPISVGGSGSTYIYGYIDAHYERGMEKEDCVDFIVNALSLAMERDGSSGGCVRLVIIDRNGVERRTIDGNELPIFGEVIDFDCVPNNTI